MLIYSYVRIRKWVFSDETEGIRSRSLALKKSCSVPQLSILFNTASITKTRLLLPEKKKKSLLQSRKEKKYCNLVWESHNVRNPSICPPFSTRTRDYHHWSLMPLSVPGLCTVAGGPGALQALCCSGRWAGRLTLRCQTQGLCSGCRLLAVAAGGKAVVWVWPGQLVLGESRLGRGACCKVSMNLA